MTVNALWKIYVLQFQCMPSYFLSLDRIWLHEWLYEWSFSLFSLFFFLFFGGGIMQDMKRQCDEKRYIFVIHSYFSLVAVSPF
ncbi:hypothetical protein SLEP1_g26504 [Rubroshorea leprosula]|uniref:Uncharacterized protein n=1 Tax=Rubroshorea leprosula TaxID=152421 RepID=A0AAV5JTJ4_9ROSI|nr:hypothetical protein SLEP1_g26504 [Rubroshorea leprosula]